KRAGVGHIQLGKVQARSRGAFLGFFQLLGDPSGRGDGEVFYRPNSDFRVENDGQKAIFIDVEDEQAVDLTLLIDAAEIGLAHQRSDAPVAANEAADRAAMVVVSNCWVDPTWVMRNPPLSMMMAARPS